MGLMLLLKKIVLLFLLISASLLSASFAGRPSRSGSNSEKEVGLTQKDAAKEQLHHDQELTDIHERLLRGNAKDYGSYDPTPALSKPPFKLIPN